MTGVEAAAASCLLAWSILSRQQTVRQSLLNFVFCSVTGAHIINATRVSPHYMCHYFNARYCISTHLQVIAECVCCVRVLCVCVRECCVLRDIRTDYFVSGRQL